MKVFFQGSVQGLPAVVMETLMGFFDGVCSTVTDCFFLEVGVGWGWMQNFFACLSPLSLLHLFKFTDVFISPGCSPSIFFSLFGFLGNDGD